MAKKRRTGLLLALALALSAILVVAVVLAVAPSPPDVVTPESDVTENVEEPVRTTGRAPPTPRERVTAEGSSYSDESVEEDAVDVPTPTHSPVGRDRMVHVTVVDERGGPVRDARVSSFSMHVVEQLKVTPEDATTDVAGKVTIRVPGASGFRVRAWTRDAAAIGDRISAAPDAELEVTLVMHPGREVAGRIESDVRTPIAGARVWLKLPTDDPFGLFVVTHADAEGRFRLGGVADFLLDDPKALVLATARSYVMLEEPIAHHADPSDLELRMERGQILFGRCVATGSAPVAGVRVSVDAAHAETARDGRFELTGVSRDGGFLELKPTSHVVPAPIRIAPATGEVDLGDILLLEGLPISGVVVDGEGKPVAWAAVVAHEQAHERNVRQTQADHEGRFTLPHIGEGPHTITAVPTQGGEWSSRVSGFAADVSAGTTGLRIVVAGARTLLVSFKSQANREPVKVDSAEVEVTRTDVDTGKTVSAWAGPGMTTVRISFPEPGTYRVVVKVPGYEPATLEEVEILDDRETRIDALFREQPR
jgi:hypothetical protein